MRAAETGRGPPYDQTMGRDDDVNGRKRDGKEEDPRLQVGAPPRRVSDRVFITGSAGTRVHWAMGLLSVEEDMKAMGLNG